MFSRLVTIILFLFTLGLSGFFQSKTGTAGVETNNPLNTITVNSTADVIADDGQCTLREAITAANSDSTSGSQVGECASGVRDDLVLVPAGHYILTRVGGDENANATGDLDITDSVIIRGAGVRNTIIDGNNTDRVFHATASRVGIEDLVVTNGHVHGGHPLHGGGIAYLRAGGELTLRRVAVRNNEAGQSTGSTPGGDGGGLYSYGAIVYIEQSEFSNNQAGVRSSPSNDRPGYGGGIFLYESVATSLISNSTISGNHADDNALGGGVYIWATTGSTTLSQSTIANNQTGVDGEGGGIFTASTTALRGVIIAGNNATTGVDCQGIFTSLSGNLIENSTDCVLQGGEGDQTNLDAQVGSLQDNGGLGTYTHAPLLNSPALDRGICDEPTADQRGLPRSVDMPGVPNGLSICDVGAHESAVPAGTATVTASATSTATSSPTVTNTPVNTPTPGTPPPYILVNTTADGIADDGYCTLREAIRYANTGENGGPQPGECFPHSSTIVVPAGHYKLTVEGANEDEGRTGDLDFFRGGHGFTLRGAGANQTIIDGNGIDRVFHIFVGTAGQAGMITIEDLTVVNGRAPSGVFPHGGGIALDGYGYSLVTLRRIAVRENTAGDGTATQRGGSGGGIYAQTRIQLEDSEISNNQAGAKSDAPGAPPSGSGGGIYIFGNNRDNFGSISRTTISGNRVPSDSYGGGLYLRRLQNTFSFPLVGVTIADNQIGDGTNGYGAGIAAMDTARVNLENTLIANNRSLLGTDCFTLANTPFESRGGNLIGSDADCFFTPRTEDQLNVDPRLEPLQDNGGVGTHTHSLMIDSPAIDHGSCTATRDQRGYPRPVDMPTIPNGITPCDVGALEIQTAPGTATITVTPSKSPTITPSPTSTHTPTPTLTPSVTATTLPSGNIIVNSTADLLADDGHCTLREAIIAANEENPSGTLNGECAAGSGGADTILIPAGEFQLSRAGQKENRSRYGDLDIRSDIIFLGAGRNETILDARGIDRVMEIQSGIVVLEGMTITGGKAPDGIIAQALPESGGGLLIHGNAVVTIADSTVHNNRAGNGDHGNQASPFGQVGGNGGGISETGGTVWLRNTLIEANTTGNGGFSHQPPDPYPPNSGGASGSGAGIYLSSPAVIEDSTVNNNLYGIPGSPYGVVGEGGGMYAVGDVTIRGSTFMNNEVGFSAHSATVENSTFVGNGVGIVIRNGLEATGITVAYNDVGLRALDFALLGNSLIDQNDNQCEGTVISQGYNLFGVGFACELYGVETGNQLGVDARLAPLQDNGGRTHTIALLADSPALDAGNCFGLTTDQRGFPRPSDLPTLPNSADGCDIGAYEEQAPIPTATNTPTMIPSPTTTPTISSESQSRLYLPLIRK